MRHIILSIALIVLFAGACFAGSSDSRVVVVIANNLSIRDIAHPSFPYLDAMLRDGSAGLMNIRTGRPSHDVEDTATTGMEAGCVTISAGTMAVGGAEVRRAAAPDALLYGVPVSSVYNCRTGGDAARAAILHTEIVKITRANEAASYRAIPGNLGDILKKSGIKTAVIGNSDMPNDIHREAVAVAMDRAGRVDFGNVDSPDFVTPDPEAPYGVRTNVSALIREFDCLPQASRFIVVDFGDTLRAERYAESCTQEQAMLNKHRAVLGLNELIKQLTGKLDNQRDLLILVSPALPAIIDLEEDRLTPIVMLGPGFNGGFLTSASTRRDGVVTISDITPTILRFFDIDDHEGMAGREISPHEGRNIPETLLGMNEDVSLQTQRQPVMRGCSVFQSVVVVIVTLCALLWAAYPVSRYARWLALIPAVLPLVMLYMPLIYDGGLVGSIIALSLLTAVAVVLCAALLRSPLRALVWLCGALVLGLMIDLLLKAPLISSSITGYSVAEGARYYGIGNELMGTMVGATVIGVGAALAGSRLSQRVRMCIAAAVFIPVFIFIGLPSLGANTGGALAAVPAIAVALMARRGWKPSARGVVLIALVTVLAVGGLFLLDATRGTASQSHMGRAVDMAASGEGSGLLMVFQRKLALNFMLVSTSLWSKLLGLSILASGFIYWWGRRKMGEAFLDREESAAVMGCCVGIAAAFIFNDSGVVAAATCAVFLWMLLVLKILYIPVSKKKAGG